MTNEVIRLAIIILFSDQLYLDAGGLDYLHSLAATYGLNKSDLQSEIDAYLKDPQTVQTHTLQSVNALDKTDKDDLVLSVEIMFLSLARGADLPGISASIKYRLQNFLRENIQ